MHELSGIMPDVKELHGKLYSDIKILHGNVRISDKTYIHDRFPDYIGDYEITPKVDSQTLETKDTSVRDDITIKPIPYEEVSNEYGITVSIGS